MPMPEKVFIPAAKDPGQFHFYVSLVKSSIRIGAGIALIMGSLVWAGALLIGAEVLGIVEEL
tara:strand:+ start:228 stop:413 length:186 start_codon:yes stop_codon:yes gene_type:complete